MLTEFLSAERIKQLWKVLQTITKGRNEQLQKITDIFGPPKDLAKYYVQPNCQHINPANEDEDEPISVVRSPVFNTINMFLNGTFAITGDGRNQFFVLADAGMGKTSLLMMIKLSHMLSFWPKDYDCVLEKIGTQTIDNISKIKNKKDTVLLLDALDEDPLAWSNMKKRVLELLEATKYFKRVIISCRTQFFPNDEIEPFKRPGRIKISTFVCPMIYLSLFDDNQVEEYLCKRFKGSTYIETREKAKAIISKMGSLRFRPLLLAYIDAFIDSSVQEWNEFEVYNALVTAWLMREENKLKTANMEVSHDMLLNACIKIAAIMQGRKARELNKCELTMQPELSLLKHINIGGRSLLNVNSEGQYRFAHYTIQEFLIAFGIRKGIIRNIKEPLRTTPKMLEFLFATPIPLNNLSMLDLSNSDFTKFDISQADFASCKMANSRFCNMNLSNINFRSADLRQASFESCSLKSAILHGANMESTRFSSCTITKTNFLGIDLKNCKINNTTITECDFSRANLRSSDFINAKITNSKFYLTFMVNNVMRECKISNSNFTKSRLNGSNLTGTDLETITFVETDLSEVNFANAKILNSDLRRAIFDKEFFGFSKTDNPKSDLIFDKQGFNSEFTGI